MSDKSKPHRVTVEGWEEYPTYYIPTTYTCIRVSELPEDMQEPLHKFMRGQTMPLIEGFAPGDLVYLHDFQNFLAAGKLFWD